VAWSGGARTMKAKTFTLVLATIVVGLGCSEERPTDSLGRDLSSKALAERLETVEKLHGVQYATKEVTLVGSPGADQIWIEHWKFGQKVEGERPPPEQSTSASVGPRDGTQELHCAAIEEPPGSGRVRLLLRIVDRKRSFASVMEVDLPDNVAHSGWFLRPVAEETSINGSGSVEAFAVWRMLHAESRLRRSTYANPTARRVEAFVVNYGTCNDPYNPHTVDEDP